MSNTIHALDADTKAMLRSRLAAAGVTSKTDDEADVGEWLGIALDALDEAEAARAESETMGLQAMSEAATLRADLTSSRELVGVLVGSLTDMVDTYDPRSIAGDFAREALAQARKV
jgi:hypothetical protein